VSSLWKSNLASFATFSACSRRSGRVGRCSNLICSLSVLLVLTFADNASAQDKAEIHPVVIDYFFEHGCPDCERVKVQVLAELKTRFDGFYLLKDHDLSSSTNIPILIAYQEKLNITNNEPVCMVIDYRYVHNGFNAIKEGLFSCVNERVSEHLDPSWKPPEPILIPTTREGIGEAAESRLSRFTLPMVVGAGLLDGINPCAISTLVFFMSMLAVSKIRGWRLLTTGACFCLASFATYITLGFGVLHGLKLLHAYKFTQFGLDLVMMVVLAVFAFLSFRDAYRFRATGRADSVTLQLSAAMKARIHKIMRQGLHVRVVILGAFGIGMAVTVLESVCTGQMYIPTMVAVIKTGHSATRAWSYLFLYNLMFILPLVIVLILTYFGLKTETLLDWSRKNVVISKSLMGVFFMGLLVLIGLM